MRKYTPKDDVQQKSYYSDRFFVSPQTPKKEVSSDEVYKKDMQMLSSKFEVLNSYIEIDELVVFIKPYDNKAVLEFFKQKLDYEMLMELSCIDYISSKKGFEVFYEMLSLKKKKRVRIKTFVKQNQEIASVSDVFKMANWSEREMYDMYGLKVANHPNLKRILMPDDWYDYPLLKTYPLQGDEAASWYEVDKIFGKSAREEIGPEIRDSAAISRYDTKRFSRLGHEVPYGVKVDENSESKNSSSKYQEEGGVFLIKKFDEKNSVTLKKRK